MYNTPAPTWLRVLRDSWNTVTAFMITYFSVYGFSDHVEKIISANLALIGFLLTMACILLKRGK